MIQMSRRAAEQLVSLSWKVLKASRRGFEKMLAYEGSDETELARIQIVVVGGVITVCMVILLFVLQNHVSVLVSINIILLWVFLLIFWVLLHILGKKRSLPLRNDSFVNISLLDETQLTKSLSTTE